MKFSVLIPTRDRLEYLRHAVETVRRQRYSDWEVIVSDNCSQDDDNCSHDDVARYVEELGDPRVKYFRTEEVVPVTTNWNNALERSAGDYVVMLGDDDGLMPDYFTELLRTIEEFGEPDVVYSRAYLLAYPGVMPGHESGYLHEMGCADFFRALERPRLLERETARDLVKRSMDFRLGFDFNMQLFTISRRTIERLRRNGQFFHSPYPDYYAANLLFLNAERIVVHPDPLVVVGITRKSYGFFHFNRREGEGVEFLQNLTEPDRDAALERGVMPGSRMNTCWLLAMETLRALDRSGAHLHVNHRRYRMLQVFDAYKRRYVERSLPAADFAKVTAAMRISEKLALGPARLRLSLLSKVGSSSRGRELAADIDRRAGQYPRWEPAEVFAGRYRDLLDVFEDHERRRTRMSA